MNAILDSLRGTLIVSCQAYPGEAMLDPRTMSQVALAAVAGGAAALRAKGRDDLAGGGDVRYDDGGYHASAPPEPKPPESGT